MGAVKLFDHSILQPWAQFTNACNRLHCPLLPPCLISLLVHVCVHVKMFNSSAVPHGDQKRWIVEISDLLSVDSSQSSAYAAASPTRSVRPSIMFAGAFCVYSLLTHRRISERKSVIQPIASKGIDQGVVDMLMKGCTSPQTAEQYAPHAFVCCC